MGAEGETTRAGDPFRIRVAILIAVVSMAGAFVTARASLLSVQASDLDQLSLQQLVQQQQLLADIEGQVAQDLRLFGPYQEHVLAWRLLEKDAAEARGRLAEDLEAHARERLALARSMRPFFSFQPDLGDDEGLVEYDPVFTRRHLVDTSVDLGDLRPEDTFATAQALLVQIVRLIGVAALLIAALVFLTLAQLTRPAVRRTFAASGGVVFALGIALFAVVEVAAP